MKTKLIYLFVIVVLAGCGQKYSGVVTNSEGKALSGVKVTINGTNYGTNTDESGKWSIEPQDSELGVIRITSYNVCYTKLLRKNTSVITPNSES